MRYETFWSNLADDYLTVPVPVLNSCQRCGGVPHICWLYPADALPLVLCRSCTDSRELVDLNTVKPELWPLPGPVSSITDEDISLLFDSE